MARRIRSIKPEWLDDEALLRCSSDARVASIGLLLLADDYGNGRGSDLYLGAQIFPGETLAKIREALAQLSRARFVGFYEMDGQRYFTVRNWEKHQKVDHPGKPSVPAPLPELRETLGKFRETLATDQEGKGSGPGRDQDQDQYLVPMLEEAHREVERRPALSLAAPAARASKPREQKRSPEQQIAARAIKSAYEGEYLAKYGKPPPWGAREWKQLYDLLGSWPAAEVLRLVPLFFVWRHQRVIQNGHQWGRGSDCFVMKLGELQADVLAPERRKDAAIAADRQKQEDHSHTTDDQATRVAQMVLEKRNANGSGTRAVREADPAARGLLAPHIGQGALAVDRQTVELHRAGARQGPGGRDASALDSDAWGSGANDDRGEEPSEESDIA